MLQFLRLYFYLYLMFFVSNTLANDSITKILPLSAHIDNEKFFSYKITKFDFDDNELVVNYNNSTEQFYSIATDIILDTDIPLGFPAGFELIATDLSSYCKDAKGDVVKSDFANYWVDDEKLVQGTTLHFDSFNNFNHPDAFFLNDKRAFTVSFDSLTNFDVSKAFCQGAATLVVSLDF